jgi:hypothetical protein
MKKKYHAPEIKVVNVRTHLLNIGSNNTVDAVNGNVFTTMKAGSVSARSREFDWDDDEE